MSIKLRIATAQFPVSGNIATNYQFIEAQIIAAAKAKAELIHFYESCLTGYPGIDIRKCENNPNIETNLRYVADLAAQHAIWVLIGSHYFDNQDKLPLNSVFVFDDSGNQLARYDKRVLYGEPGQGDRAQFREGSSAVIFYIKQIKCGIIICHEWRYPEIFRDYAQNDVNILFHSFYDGNLSIADYKANGIELGELILGSERGNSANNNLWLSVANTSKSEQVLPSCVIRPDGSIKASSKRNNTELLITDIDFEKQYIDPSYHGRKRILELYPKSR